MPKSFKEYLGLPTIMIGGLDSYHPIASLGDSPPKDQGSRDSRAVGLTAQDTDPTDKDSKDIQKKINNKKNSIKEDGMMGPGMGTYNPEPSMDTSSNAKKTKKEDLYTDDNPRDTVKGTGYGDAATARKTLRIIKSVDKQRQMQIVNTLYNRAKHHANQTSDMRAAMSIFKTWIDNNKIKESILYKHMIDRKILKD